MTRTSAAFLFAMTLMIGCTTDPMGLRTTYRNRVVPPQSNSQPVSNAPIAVQPGGQPLGASQTAVLPQAAISNMALAQGQNTPVYQGQNLYFAQGQRPGWNSPFPMLASAGAQFDGRPFPYLMRQAKAPRPGGVTSRKHLVRQTAIANGIAASPMEDLKFRGGKTIQNLKFMNIYVGSSDMWDASDVKNIDKNLAAAMSDRRLNNVMSQYFNNAPVSSSFLGSFFMKSWKPKRVEKRDISAQIQGLYQGQNFKGIDLPNTVFNFILPHGTVLGDPSAGQQATTNLSKAIPTADEEDSTGGLGGYHGSVHMGNDTVYYAVGVFSERLPNNTTNGIPVFDQNWKNVVGTFYHELQEARTDADVDDAATSPNGMAVLGWTSDSGQEIGDYPIAEAQQLLQVFKEVPLVDGSGTVPIQLVYSNAVHGPEGPIEYPHGMEPPPGTAPPNNPAPGNTNNQPSNSTPSNNTPSSNAGLPPQLQNWDQLQDNVKWAILKLLS